VENFARTAINSYDDQILIVYHDTMVDMIESGFKNASLARRMSMTHIETNTVN